MFNYPKNRGQYALLIIIVVGIFFIASDAHALTLSPARFEVSGNPGDTIEQEMIILNESEGDSIYYPSFANFQASGESGSPLLVEPKEDLGTWMTTTPSLTLKSKEQKTVKFKITIPKDAEPGGHFAVIIWGTSPPNGKAGLSVGFNTGILVLLSVNGNVKESAGLLNFNTVGKKFWYSTLPVSFEYRFRNDGGDRIKPVGTVKILDTLFLPAKTLNANPVNGNILPNSTRKFNVNWINFERPNDYVQPTKFFKKFLSDVEYQWKNFAVGLYSAHFNITYGALDTHTKKTVFFFVFPWQLVLVMLLVIIIVFWGGKKLIKRYNRYVIKKARAGMKLPPESSHG